MVEQTIDLEAAEKNDFMVRPDFDDELKGQCNSNKCILELRQMNKQINNYTILFTELKETMDELEEKMQSQVNKAANDLDIEAGKTLKIESNQQFGYYFRVSLKEEKVLRNKKNYTILDSNKSGVRFRNAKLTELNEDYVAARDKYSTQQKSVVTEIIGIAGLPISKMHK